MEEPALAGRKTLPGSLRNARECLGGSVRWRTDTLASRAHSGRTIDRLPARPARGNPTEAQMARSIWKGSIAFGLVSIPVELFPAEDRKSFKFSMLDKRDFSPVGYKRYSKETGKEVEWSNIVKGYEYEKGQYVVLSDEDFRRANVKASRTIEIRTFVSATELSPQFFESPYYLVPGNNGEKVYAL